jgi:hypothetical protein
VNEATEDINIAESLLRRASRALTTPESNMLREIAAGKPPEEVFPTDDDWTYFIERFEHYLK